MSFLFCSLYLSLLLFFFLERMNYFQQKLLHFIYSIFLPLLSAADIGNESEEERSRSLLIAAPETTFQPGRRRSDFAEGTFILLLSKVKLQEIRKLNIFSFLETYTGRIIFLYSC